MSILRHPCPDVTPVLRAAALNHCLSFSDSRWWRWLWLWLLGSLAVSIMWREPGRRWSPAVSLPNCSWTTQAECSRYRKSEQFSSGVRAFSLCITALYVSVTCCYCVITKMCFYPPPQAELHTGALPSIQAVALRGEKLHRVFHSTLDHLVHIMNGFCLPEPFFSVKVKKNSHACVCLKRCKLWQCFKKDAFCGCSWKSGWRGWWKPCATPPCRSWSFRTSWRACRAASHLLWRRPSRRRWRSTPATSPQCSASFPASRWVCSHIQDCF